MSSSDHVFGGRYRIVGEVGRGGMGVIYRGVDLVLDREVAIKVMATDLSEITDEARARFFREAKAAAKLQHRNIVTVFEFAEQDGIPYIVMEFLKGRSLSARMRAQPPLMLDQKLDIMTELCNGLQFAHENGVVHRDVKPANVWILDDGAVKLVDFGIAKIASSMMTIRGDVMGSASYMSPEQIEGLAVTGRSDVFSAAIVLYEMVARRRPFEGDSPTATMMQIVQGEPPPIDSIVPDLPRELVEVIARGLEKDPEKRFRTAAEFGTELQLIRMSLPREEETYLQPASEVVTAETLQFKAEPLPSHTATVPDRRARGWGMRIGAGAAILAIAALLYWFNRPRTAPQAPPQQTTQNAPAGPGGTPAGPVDELRTVTVDSRPSGASIAVNGTDTGRLTPSDIQIAAGGAIRLERRGSKPLDATLTEADLQRGKLSYELQPVEAAEVQVQITGTYPFEVWEGARRLQEAESSHSVRIQDGRTLILRSPEHFLNREFRIDARGGKTFRISAPELGVITLSGSEQCLVIVDGRRTDHYLMQELPPMAAGDHEFSFSCRDGSIIRPIRHTVTPGENPTRQVK